MVQIHIYNITSQISGDIDESVLGKIMEDTSYYIQGSEFSSYCQSGGWDGNKRLFNMRAGTFPTGIISRVKKVLDDCDVVYNIADHRVAPVITEIPFNSPGAERYYQTEAINRALSCTRGVIKLPTGSGKTYVLSKIIAKTNVNTIVVSFTNTVFHQLHRELEAMLGVKVGKIGDGLCDIQKINVAMAQSLTRTVKVGRGKKIVTRSELSSLFHSVECLITDECHHAPAESVQAISNSCQNAYYRFGLSATPMRDDLLDILIESVTGKRLIDVSISELISAGFLAKPTIHCINFKQKKQASNLKWKEFYTETVVTNDKRNQTIAEIARSYIKRGKSVLISVQRKQHGEEILKYLTDLDSVRYVNGDDSTELINDTLKELDSKSLLCAIATSVYKEGVDIRNLDCLILANATASLVNTIQIVGRVLRKTQTKTHVDVFDIMDFGCRWLDKHSITRTNFYNSEPEFIVKNYM